MGHLYGFSTLSSILIHFEICGWGLQLERVIDLQFSMSSDLAFHSFTVFMNLFISIVPVLNMQIDF